MITVRSLIALWQILGIGRTFNQFIRQSTKYNLIATRSHQYYSSLSEAITIRGEQLGLMVFYFVFCILLSIRDLSSNRTRCKDM